MRQAFFVLCLFAALGLGCGDGRFPGMASNDSTLVGIQCFSNDDCDLRLCQQGSSFPGGICTLSCGNDSDCPVGSSCAGLTTGWVCLIDCETTADCREQWSCESVTRPPVGDADAGVDPGSFMGCIAPPQE